MNTFKLFGAASLVFALSACSNQQAVTKTTDSADNEILSNGTSVLTRPIVADMQIDQQRASITYEADLLLPLEDLRQNALAQFLRIHSCDYAVDPIYYETVTSVKRSINSITITIEAYPARYTQLAAVDSLPKSILEYQRVDLPQERVAYITERTLPETSVGFELTTGNHFGIQVDAPIPNSALRGYFATEAFSENHLDQRSLEITTTESSSTSSTNRYAQGITMFSLGLMKDVEQSDRISLRAIAGLNVGLYDHSSVYIGPRSFNATSLVGLRIGGGLDLRIFRNQNLFLVGKAHRNINLLRFHDWTGQAPSVQSTTLDRVTAKGPIVDFGIGLRFEF